MNRRFLLIVFAVLSTSLWGQQSSDAVVLGSVTEASHAAIPGATVTITSAATAAIAQVHTNAQGEYRTPPLRIGEYRVSVEVPGFRQFSENNVRLSIGTATNLTFAGGFPAGALTPAGETNVLTVSDDTNGRWPRSQQWNVNVQRSLPGDVLLEVGYAGNSLTGAWMQYDANQPLPGAGSANANRPFHTLAVTGTPYVISSLADILRIDKVGYGYYNALQTKLEKRYSSGFSLLAAYSYSKTISLGENQSNGVQDIHNFQADRSVSSQDMTHHLTASVVYDLPFGRGKRFGADWNRYVDSVAGGWSIDPIFPYSSGQPFNLTVTGNPSNTGTGLGGSNDRPNLVGDLHASINPSTNTPTRTKAQWFNTAAFAANSPYTFGNAGRNILRADGPINLDLSGHKRIKIAEGISVQLRLEAFNIANHDVLAAPNAAVGSSTFGQVTSASSTARELQAAVKVSF